MEEVKIKTKKGDISAVIHRPEEKTGKLAILCPGYLDSKNYNHLVYLAHDLCGSGYTVVRFDPIGVWNSGGSISDYTVSECLENIKSIIEYMLLKGDYKNILLGGHSRGGLISILYAVTDPRVTTVLAIMSPYALIRIVNKDKIEKWKKEGFKISTRDIPYSGKKKKFKVPYSHIEDGKKYNALDTVQKLETPLVLVAGELDDVIPLEDVRLMYDKANEPKQFIFMEGIGHDYRHNLDYVKKVNHLIVDSEYIR